MQMLRMRRINSMNLKGVGGIKVFLTEEAEKIVFPLIIDEYYLN